jgi:hypothetical protein
MLAETRPTLDANLTTDISQNPTSDNSLDNTWAVWNVTNPSDEYSVLEGLSEQEAKDLAQKLTDNPEKVYIDPETGVEHDGVFEARETHTSTTESVQKPPKKPEKKL